MSTRINARSITTPPTCEQNCTSASKNSPGRRSEPHRPQRIFFLRVQLLIKSQLERFPYLDAVARPLFRAWMHLFRKGRRTVAIATQSFRGNGCHSFHVNRTIWVSPQDITFCALREFNIDDFAGMVVGGDWDRLEKRFDDLDVYHAFRAVLLDGESWHNTVYYQRILDSLNRGNIQWGCRGQEDLDKRCAALERLFYDIKDRGYKLQEQLSREPDRADRAREDDEVTVSIGRNGDLLFSNCAHRLSIAKILRIQQIPVRVAVRHPEWVKYVKRRLQSAEFREMHGVFASSVDLLMMSSRSQSERLS